MNKILPDILPLSLPSPFLTIIGDCFGITLVMTVVITALIRLFWRRGKGMYDL
jgi:hypothetical protein